MLVIGCAAWVNREPPALPKAALFSAVGVAASAGWVVRLALRRGPIKWDARAGFLAVGALLAITVPGFWVAYTGHAPDAFRWVVNPGALVLLIAAFQRLLRP